MATIQAEIRDRREQIAEIDHEIWHHWPVNWTAVLVGALTSLVMVLILGLVGLALGMHLATPENRVVDLKTMTIGAAAISIFGAFFAFVVGGWVCGRVAGILHAETAMLHAAIAWLVSVPLLVAMVTLGAGNAINAWYSGVASRSVDAPYTAPALPIVGAMPQEVAQYRTDLATYQADIKKWNDETPRVTRNSAISATTALLLGLMGSVIGGWLATAGRYSRLEPSH